MINVRAAIFAERRHLNSNLIPEEADALTQISGQCSGPGLFPDFTPPSSATAGMGAVTAQQQLSTGGIQRASSFNQTSPSRYSPNQSAPVPSRIQTSGSSLFYAHQQHTNTISNMTNMNNVDILLQQQPSTATMMALTNGTGAYSYSHSLTAGMTMGGQLSTLSAFGGVLLLVSKRTTPSGG